MRLEGSLQLLQMSSGLVVTGHHNYTMISFLLMKLSKRSGCDNLQRTSRRRPSSLQPFPSYSLPASTGGTPNPDQDHQNRTSSRMAQHGQ